MESSDMIAVCQGAFDAKHVIGQDEYEPVQYAYAPCNWHVLLCE